MQHGSTIKVCFMSNIFHYSINNVYTLHYICSAWFLDIRTSICLHRRCLCMRYHHFCKVNAYRFRITDL